MKNNLSRKSETERLQSQVEFNAGMPKDLLYRKLAWRIMPLLLFCQLFAYLDRINIGLAKLQMGRDVNLSAAAYGFGAGIFFLGYFLFEVPSNVLLHKFGARRWIARIMVSWGLLSAATMLITNTTAFYILRFLLGIAEAGFFPGIILYLTLWFPAARRGRMTTLFMTATAISGVIGSPVSGAIIAYFDGWSGLAGWQWLFILEGLPSAILGVVVYRYLDDSIESAAWLDVHEKMELRAALDADLAKHDVIGRSTASRWTMVALASLIYFLLLLGLYGIGFWLPTIISEAGIKTATKIGFLSAIPYITAAALMNVVASSADRRHAWKSHVAMAALIAATALAASAWWASAFVPAIAMLSVATAAILSALPLFWNLPTMILSGVAAASGIAIINSMGNLSGFVGPVMIGWLVQRTHSTIAGVIFLAVALLLAGISTFFFPTARSNRS